MRSRRFVGLLILGISALIAAISSVTAAAISLDTDTHGVVTRDGNAQRVTENRHVQTEGSVLLRKR